MFQRYYGQLRGALHQDLKLTKTQHYKSESFYSILAIAQTLQCSLYTKMRLQVAVCCPEVMEKLPHRHGAEIPACQHDDPY
jgi:hypothetical protein